MGPATRRSSGVMARSSQTCEATRSRSFPPRMSHAYSACRARARARVSTLVRPIEPLEQVRHLERGDRRVPSLVAMLAARARLGLLHRVRREETEADRDLVLGARVGEPARRFAGDVVEVRGVTAHDGAD